VAHREAKGPSARSQRGVLLAEILVALALFVLVVAVALTHYEAARRALDKGGALVDLQQSLRAGFDRITDDVRAAGLGTNPDGHPLRPDEGIEVALATAMAIRADLDGHTDRATDPEHDLARGGPFASVPTGNDEILVYVLAKADGSSPGTLHFDADVVGVPRDGVVERVTVAHVALMHDDPPYTLYRVTVRPDSTHVVRAPVIDHVRSLRFTYFDGAGRPLVPPGGADTGAARSARASIRSVRIELEGLTRHEDPRWLDPHDGYPPTRRRRKFRLAGEVAPRNLGLVDPVPSP